MNNVESNNPNAISKNPRDYLKELDELDMNFLWQETCRYNNCIQNVLESCLVLRYGDAYSQYFEDHQNFKNTLEEFKTVDYNNYSANIQSCHEFMKLKEVTENKMRKACSALLPVFYYLRAVIAELHSKNN